MKHRSSLRIVILGPMLMLLSYFWLNSFIMVHMLPVVHPRPEVLNTEISTSGLLFRDEQVIEAPETGRVRMIRGEGARIPRGAPVFKILPKREDNREQIVISPRAGLLSYCIELPVSIPPLKVGDLSGQELENIAISSRSTGEGGLIERGDPAFIVVDNHIPPLLAVFYAQEVLRPHLIEGMQRKTFQFVGDGLTVEGIRVGSRTDGKKEIGLYRLLDAPDEIFLIDRQVKVRITLEREGLMSLPERSLVYESETPYIYIHDNSGYQKREVAVIKRQNGQAIIKDKVENRVLLNPHFVEIGKDLFF